MASGTTRSARARLASGRPPTTGIVDASRTAERGWQQIATRETRASKSGSCTTRGTAGTRSRCAARHTARADARRTATRRGARAASAEIRGTGHGRDQVSTRGRAGAACSPFARAAALPAVRASALGRRDQVAGGLRFPAARRNVVDGRDAHRRNQQLASRSRFAHSPSEARLVPGRNSQKRAIFKESPRDLAQPVPWVWMVTRQGVSGAAFGVADAPLHDPGNALRAALTSRPWTA